MPSPAHLRGSPSGVDAARAAALGALALALGAFLWPELAGAVLALCALAGAALAGGGAAGNPARDRIRARLGAAAGILAASGLATALPAPGRAGWVAAGVAAATVGLVSALTRPRSVEVR